MSAPSPGAISTEMEGHETMNDHNQPQQETNHSLYTPFEGMCDREFQYRLELMKSRTGGSDSVELTYDRTTLAISGGLLALLMAFSGASPYTGDIVTRAIIAVVFLAASLSLGISLEYRLKKILLERKEYDTLLKKHTFPNPPLNTANLVTSTEDDWLEKRKQSLCALKVGFVFTILLFIIRILCYEDLKP